MAISKVAVANLALQKLGASRIAALDEDSANARSMNAAYERVRRRLIRAYDWGFAITRASIAADASDTLFGDWNRFSKPNDYLRLLMDNEDDTVVDWRIEGLYIVTKDASPLEIRYLADVDDPNVYDESFVEAFACALALQCCEEVTGSTNKKESIREDFAVAIREGKKLGSFEKAEKDPPEDEWVEARR